MVRKLTKVVAEIVILVLFSSTRLLSEQKPKIVVLQVLL
ncbi:MAG: hypothetical protein DDT40_01389 [candidate division WS2 bacterium]|nr:hypothetical protein [Candidatus Psychracetigena formicireducens]